MSSFLLECCTPIPCHFLSCFPISSQSTVVVRVTQELLSLYDYYSFLSCSLNVLPSLMLSYMHICLDLLWLFFIHPLLWHFFFGCQNQRNFLFSRDCSAYFMFSCGCSWCLPSCQSLSLVVAEIVKTPFCAKIKGTLFFLLISCILTRFFPAVREIQKRNKSCIPGHFIRE